MAQSRRRLNTTEARQLLTAALSGEGGSDPYPVFHRVRESAPVLRGPGGLIVLTRYADCEVAFRHRGLGLPHDAFTGWAFGGVVDDDSRQALGWVVRTMMMSNPPEHSRLRRVVSSAFTPRHVSELGPEIAAHAEQLLGKLAGQPGADFMSEVALTLPVKVMARLLGIPYAETEFCIPLCIELGKPLVSKEAIARAVAAQAKLRTYLTDLLALKRRAPADDLLSRLVTYSDEGKLNDEEVMATAVLLFGAGLETTTNLLGNGLLALLRNPDQLELLREQPDLIGSAIEEMLRYDAPIQVDLRTVLEATTLAGVELTPGQAVMALLGAANRDPERFTNPDRFDITRDEGANLAFTAGIHFCLGAHLAKLEARELFGKLLTSFQRIELVGDPQVTPDLQRRRVACMPLIIA
jgi:cytochrome P450